MVPDLWGGKYVLLYPSNHFVGVSKGVPFEASDPHDVHFWDTIEDAKEYQKHHEDLQLSVHRVEGLKVLQEKFTY